MTTDYFPDATLSGGRWVTVGLIRRWVPGDPSAMTEPETETDLACTHCGATVTEGCKAPNGTTTYHAARTRPRECPCGTVVEKGRRLCARCRLDRHKARRAALRKGRR